MPKVWEPDPIFFSLPFFDWPVRYYGLFFALAFLGGYYLFHWQIRRGGGSEEEVTSFLIPGFLGVLIGARLGHVLFYNLDYFLQNPSWIFRIWQGGLSSHGATIGLILAMVWQSYRSKRPFLDLGDRLTFSISLGAALIRLGNLFNSEIVGKVTSEPSWWHIILPRYDGLPVRFAPARYPTQVFESFLGFLILGTLIFFDRMKGQERRPRGLLSAIFLMMYFAGRFLIEFFKERMGPNDQLFFSRGQLLSILPFLLGVFFLVHCFKRKNVPIDLHTPLATPLGSPRAKKIPSQTKKLAKSSKKSAKRRKK
ncbi:MAG: prolipoprotein diacylglyceryl transferase [Deltaproteobacteria bacterium]|jgi:prolipoprotein diacylglyceryl transferase|nr:prolipoprotein diacylglyceryl transferase [Deltaproteobacteria bacterium]